MKKQIKAVDARGRKLGGDTPLLCAPLVGRTRARVLAEATRVLKQKPDLVEWRVDFFANLYMSLSDSSRFSVFVGYGVEGGGSADATIYTLGWGGVRKLPMAKPQWGFYGKFLRYRRFENDRHGGHDGLSVGTESGAGALGVRFEIGAARSDDDHWLAVVQVAFTLELAFGIPPIAGNEG